MAHKKAGGSSRNGRDSAGQRLGLKIFGREQVPAGNIISCQRGTKWHAGRNVGVGKDHTLFALINGKLEFRTKTKGRVFVSVRPMNEAAAQSYGGSYQTRRHPVEPAGPNGLQKGRPACRSPLSVSCRSLGNDAR